MHRHQAHNISLFMLGVTIEVPVTFTLDNNVTITDQPKIVDSYGDETMYCNTCKEEVSVGSEDGPKVDWEFA